MIRHNTSSNDGMSIEEPFSEDQTWISQHCAHKGLGFYCNVPDEFILDNFNLTGLDELVTNYETALLVILGGKYKYTTADKMHRSATSAKAIDPTTNILYGLIHARYIMTVEGLAAVRKKYLDGEYGNCPRVFCNGSNVLPIGLSDTIDEASVKLFCPRCNDVYELRTSNTAFVDGAFFGTGLPHMLFMMFPEMRPKQSTHQYEARLFGFKLREFAERKH